MSKKDLKKQIEILKCEKEIAENATTFTEGKMEAYRIENEVLKEMIKQQKEIKPCPFCGTKLTSKKVLCHEGFIDAYSHTKNGCILAYSCELIIRDSDMDLWNKRAAE